MKTGVNVVLAAGVLALGLGACGDEVKTIGGNEGNAAAEAAPAEATASAAQQDAETQAPAAEGYSFEISGVSLYPDMDITSVPAELGEYSHYEEESCAAQGMSHFYTFADYQINTWPDGDIDRIYYVQLKTDNVKTREGVDLSMDKDKVIEVYGLDYTEDGHRLVYEKGGMQLVFILNDDGSLASIEYDSMALGQ